MNEIKDLSESYSTHWKHIDDLILYIPNDFQYKSEIIITEIDDCLMEYITINNIGRKSVKIYNQDYINFLRGANANSSIVVISNQINNVRYNVYAIKQKTEELLNIIRLPILFIYATKPNFFMKPHTGGWKFLRQFYASRSYNIHRVTVISDAGGLKEESDGVIKILTSDIDRAFANNINARYLTIHEALGGEVQQFEWDKSIIEPSVRALYIERLSSIQNPNIIEMLSSFGTARAYAIMIVGPPRSGKTRLAKQIISEWQKSSFGNNNHVEIITGNPNKTKGKQFANYIENRISVILDGGCHTQLARSYYMKAMVKYNIPLIFIEVECGLHMARVFNHSHVESSNDPKVMLYPGVDYKIYTANKNAPNYPRKKHICYAPRIDCIPSITSFRY